MKNLALKSFGKSLTALLLTFILFNLPMLTMAQTQIKMPKIKASIEKDIKIGQEYSKEIEKVFPIIDNVEANRYIQDIGDRLTNAVPPQYKQPMNCRFKIVHARDINAFALPGCFLYINTGMIMAARNEGEMAGVMAHEIMHAQLRHTIQQQKKLNNPLMQIGIIGVIFGGAVIGGDAGAQGGMILAQAWMSKYSREFETQADISGAQTMARAGYDPNDLANMFRTIEAEGKGEGRPPEWLSSHPDPGKRYQYIENEAKLLRVSPNPIKSTRGLDWMKRYIQSLPRAKTMAEIEKEAQGKAGQNPTAGGKYSNTVALPSTQVRGYTAGDVLRANVPNNWKELPDDQSVFFAPEGAYGDDGITHGAMIGVAKGTGNLQQDTSDYLQGLLQNNQYLKQQTGYSSGRISGRNALATQLAGTSPINRKTELVTVYTISLRTGELLYVIFVVPQNEEANYRNAFNNLRNSIQINNKY